MWVASFEFPNLGVLAGSEFPILKLSVSLCVLVLRSHFTDRSQSELRERKQSFIREILMLQIYNNILDNSLGRT